MTASLVLRAERTGRADTVRWIGEGSWFSSLPSGRRIPSAADDSPLAVLCLDGRVVEVRVSCGDLFVRADSAERWHALAPDVHAALRVETPSPWLLTPTLGVDAEPSIAEVQAVLDESVGPVASSHGGRIRVAAVHPDSVVVTLHGACHGCSGSDATLTKLTAAAVAARWPHLTSVTEGRSDERERTQTRWSSVSWRRRPTPR